MINWLTKKNISKKIIMLSLANIISFNAASENSNQISSNKDLTLKRTVNITQPQVIAENIKKPIKKENKKDKTTIFSNKLSIKTLLKEQIPIITNSQINWNINVINGTGYNNLNAKFDLYIKKSPKKNNLTRKLSYWEAGLFKEDSLSDLKTGYEFDLMPEGFSDPKKNTFRYWNKLRLGGHLIYETNTNKPIKIKKTLDFIDAEITFKYLHVPQKLRGDQTLLKRKGYLSTFLGIRTNHDKHISIGVKPSGKTWIRATYQDKHYMGSTIKKAIGLDVEILTNENGYRKSFTNLTKDYYKGFSFIIGGKYDFISKSPYLNIGVKLVTRNH